MIKRRLVLGNAIALALVWATLGTVVFLTMRNRLLTSLDTELTMKTDFMQQNWSEITNHQASERGPRMAPPEERMELRGVDPEAAKRFKVSMQILRPRVFSMDGTAFGPEEVPFDADSMVSGQQGRTVFTSTIFQDLPVRLLTVPLTKDGKLVGICQAAVSLESTNRTIGQILTSFVALLPLALIITSLAGWRLTQQALTPVRRIAETAEHIEATNLAGRLAVDGNDEFSQLAFTINAMLARLQESFSKLSSAFDAQRRFTSDASHELKTPLTTIKTRTKLAMRATDHEKSAEHLAAIDRAADQMNALVQDLLMLAKSDEDRLEVEREWIALEGVVDEALHLVPQRCDHEWIVTGLASLKVFGDEALWVRAISNVMNNASRHTPVGGTITVAGEKIGPCVELWVQDTGPGIPHEHLPHLFDRFYRVDDSRSRVSGGSGLGLAIVKSIVDAHDSSVEITSIPGIGTRVTFRFA